MKFLVVVGVFFAIFATLLTFFVDFLGPQESIGELSIPSHLLISYCQLQSPPSVHRTPRSNRAELVLEQDDDVQHWNRLLPNAWYTRWCVRPDARGIQSRF